MRRRAVVTAAALPLAVGLLLSAGAGNASSAPLGSSPAVAPAEGGHDEHTGMTGHGSAGVAQPSATPTPFGTATPSPNPTPSGTSTTMEECTCGLPGDHSTHGDHAEHEHAEGAADADQGEHADHGEHGGETAPGGHDEHVGGASTDDHESHGSSPVAAPSDGTRAVVLGGFSAVNGSALVAAAVLRRRTASRRERHVTARAAAAPARPGTERSPR